MLVAAAILPLVLFEKKKSVFFFLNKKRSLLEDGLFMWFLGIGGTI